MLGGSAGALQALMTLVSSLPPSLPAALAVVIHTPADGEGRLPAILSRLTPVPVAFARDREPVRPGRIAIAPPGCHLLIEQHRYRLSDGPRENGFRPAVDPLFRTAAEHFGNGAIGVILSGALDDGAHGLSVIKAHGGVAIAQHPDDAAVPGMPQSAIAYVDLDHVAAADEIAPLLVAICTQPSLQGARMKATKHRRSAADESPQTIRAMIDRHGLASGLTCPDCGGALWEIIDGKLARYQCHVGHKYSPAGLDEGQWHATEEAVWAAIRMLEEHAELRRRLGRQAAESGLRAVATGYRDTAARAERHAVALQRLIADRGVPTAELRPPPSARRRAGSKPAPLRG